MNEQRFELTTDDKGLLEKNTRRITGHLKSVIVETPSTIECLIKLKEFDINLFKISGFSGSRYFGIKFRPLSEPSKIEDYFEDYVLDDILTIQISGPKNAKIKLILRWEDG